jgi:hypothetical protein
MRKAVLFILLLTPLPLGCVHPSGPMSVKNPDPAVKIPAIKLAVRQDNRSVAPQLVHDLDSDDAAVRFYAIQGLRRLTGNDLGYHFYEDKLDRQPAVERWKAWLKNQPASTANAKGKES